jgi:hypothetical protein
MPNWLFSLRGALELLLKNELRSWSRLEGGHEFGGATFGRELMLKPKQMEESWDKIWV